MFWFILRRNWWKITKTLIVGSFVLFAVLFASIFYWFNNNIYNDSWFNEVIWKAKTERRSSGDPPSVCDSKRIYMAEDLQRRMLKKGMTRQEVMALLGRPSALWSVRDKSAMSYYLGCDRDIFTSIIIFEVKFDKHQRMISSSWYPEPTPP